MTDPIDFPPGPTVGQRYTAPSGVVYAWNGTAWLTSYYDSATQQFQTVGDLLSHIRTLLQDTDLSSGEYRYSTDSIISNLNMGYIEMFRIRPDIFLANSFDIPQFNVGTLDAPLVIELQYVPPLVYYVVGLVQARDDEQSQDARALGFLKIFQQNIVSGGIV